MLPHLTGTVLVIEDDDAVRAVLVRALHTAGFRVQDYATGEGAVEFARRHDMPIDVLVADTLLPGISGPEAAEAIRRIRPDLSVVHMSGFANGATPATPGSAQASHFIAKPFCVQDLVDAVRTILRRRALVGAYPS